jgi:uncharacterized DUF497 family protein
MKFDWSDAKRRQNASKHGIDLADCQKVFEGRTVTAVDARFAYGEQRFVTTGFLGDIVVVIVHTETADTIRLISARKANRHEQKAFFKAVGIAH